MASGWGSKTTFSSRPFFGTATLLSVKAHGCPLRSAGCPNEGNLLRHVSKPKRLADSDCARGRPIEGNAGSELGHDHRGHRHLNENHECVLRATERSRRGQKGGGQGQSGHNRGDSHIRGRQAPDPKEKATAAQTAPN